MDLKSLLMLSRFRSCAAEVALWKVMYAFEDIVQTWFRMLLGELSMR